MNNSFYNLFVLNVREYIRQPEIIFWSFIFPLILVWLLGITFVSHHEEFIPVGVIVTQEDHWGENSINGWIRDIEKYNAGVKPSAIVNKKGGLQLPAIRLVRYNSREEAILGIKRGDNVIFVEWDSRKEKVSYHFDPVNPDASRIYLVLEQIADKERESFGTVATLHAEGTRFIDFLIPGLIAMAIMESCLWGVGWTLIERRTSKVLRQMIATPMKKYEMMGSIIFTIFMFSLIEIFGLFIFATLYFNVKIQGSILAVILLLICGNFSFTGLAILGAARIKKPQSASGVMEVIIIFLLIFSGIFFSYKMFPSWLVTIVEKLPLTILANSLRMIFIEGAGVLDVLFPASILACIGAVSFGLGLKVFKWY